MFIFDSYYILLVVPTLLLSLWAQIKVNYTFAKYSKVQCKSGLSGASAAQHLLNATGIRDVRIQHVSGHLTDHYAPGAKVLRLSDSVYRNCSVASVGVAAHETGHAVQHAKGYGPLALRSTLVPVANIGSAIGPTLAIVGIIFSYDLLTKIGIILFSAAVLFYLITLPVEINASHRAVKLLRETHIMAEDELYGVKKVLTAAAMTYIASALTSIASLLRLVFIARDRDD